MRIGALCAAVVAALLLVSASLFGAEWWLFDICSRRLAHSRPADPRIVLVSVDEESVRNLGELYGRPPYPRDVWALVVDELKRAGAKVIAFDLLFSEENRAAPEGDRAFAAAIEGAPVILAGTPHPMFRAAATGKIDLAREQATVHTYPLNGSLALAAADLFETGGTGSQPVPAGLRARRSSGNDEALLVRWNGAKANPEDLSYAHVDLDKVILAALRREEATLDAATAEAFAKNFRGKIVLVGYTAKGLVDLRANPLSPVAAGVELHANAIDNLINRDFTAPLRAARRFR